MLALLLARAERNPEPLSVAGDWAHLVRLALIMLQLARMGC